MHLTASIPSLLTFVIALVAVVQIWMIWEQRRERQRRTAELIALVRLLRAKGIRVSEGARDSGFRIQDSAGNLPKQQARGPIEKIPAKQWFTGKPRIVSVEPIKRA